jgi:hypothetical protein
MGRMPGGFATILANNVNLAVTTTDKVHGGFPLDKGVILLDDIIFRRAKFSD